MPKQSEFKGDIPAVCLDLCGKRFFVALDHMTAECCEKLLDGAKARLGVLEKGIADKSTSDKEICRFLSRGLDELLGRRAVRKVLGRRAVCLDEVTGLMCFVLTALSEVH